jgi:hypothetical protein
VKVRILAFKTISAADLAPPIDRLVKDLHDREKAIRLWLKPDDTKDEQQRRQNERVPGTNAWFLQDKPFQDWIDPSLQSYNSRLLWVCGKPGCGKSILASSIVAQLREMEIQPIFFFFNSKSGEASGLEPIGFVRTLLFQLLDIDPRLTELLHGIFAKSGSHVASSFADLWEVFRLWCLRRSEPVFCVIDALDESFDGCEDPNDFLSTIVQTLKSCHMLRIVVTSRPSHKIEQ